MKKNYHSLSGIRSRWCMPGHNQYQSGFWMPYIYFGFSVWCETIPNINPSLPGMISGRYIPWILLHGICPFYCSSHGKPRSLRNVECLTWEDCNLSLTSAKLPIIFREIEKPSGWWKSFKYWLSFTLFCICR